MGTGLYYDGIQLYFNEQDYLSVLRRQLESERALLDAYSYQVGLHINGASITGGTITGGILTTKSDKLDEDFFKVELPKLNQNN